jgi:tRNA pseudouridine32 synthase/23S rRNA pseudouridine746 synthase
VDLPTWRERMRRGLVTVPDDSPLAPDAEYRAGLTVHYRREVADEPSLPADVGLVHVDEHLVVADKPHFLPVVPSGSWVNETLVARLAARLGRTDLVPLHRIDRLTAGLVLLSANAATRGRFQALFRERRIVKRYEAFAPPLPATALPCVLRHRLEPGEPFFRMRVTAGAPNAETSLDVLERGARAWRYSLEPHTGRKHQLRVQMAALGAAILGDPWYPELQPRGADDFERPLQLLARELEFDDPLTGERRRFASARSLHLRAEPDRCRTG